MAARSSLQIAINHLKALVNSLASSGASEPRPFTRNDRPLRTSSGRPIYLPGTPVHVASPRLRLANADEVIGFERVRVLLPDARHVTCETAARRIDRTGGLAVHSHFLFG